MASLALLKWTTRSVSRHARALVGAGARAAELRAVNVGLEKTQRRFASTDLLKTVLYDFHVGKGAKMVPFAGYAMPIQYQDSIMDSTTYCREQGSIFDVSHMLGITLTGKDAVPFIESLVVSDIGALEDGTGCLSILMNPQGGAIDDTVITKIDGERVYFVVNAGNREKDLKHINAHLSEWKASGKDVSLTTHEDRALLAVQGPEAANTLQKLVDIDLSKMYFSHFTVSPIKGIESFITRTGYTGEDGFEISIPNDGALEIIEALLASGPLKLAGLGARDSLRLEAGLCLYGNDLDDTLSPIEAGLTWTISKSRREACNFVGGDVIKQQLADGVGIRRVGLICKGAPARGGSKILNLEGEEIGHVTSGGFSPCLKKNIAMGYVKKGNQKSGTELKVEVRKRVSDAVVTKMPFVPAKYHRP
ncbi:glycine cleavage system protein T [Chloropicon primus]|uniref:Aminomethyltransferase n=2 Tax=Chloropicon primus TaxID=1764295 RepID=A0A5B8MIY4_9CHLO|nr:glycine cleavage system protein T [Chloropicon primus]UPQ99276.1 glycine cleavage system protein T [Chloropicon primus]|eukprot:QDZ20064.1 glycine cleavage system protein T [Chloropicon primus]